MTTILEVEQIVQEIREQAHPLMGSAHDSLDDLWQEVLQAIADGVAENPTEMARLALIPLTDATFPEFPRWYE